jgi:hypothetical protein
MYLTSKQTKFTKVQQDPSFKTGSPYLDTVLHTLKLNNAASMMVHVIMKRRREG